MELTTYKVTFKETADEWLFQYRNSDGIIYSFVNLKGNRILNLLSKGQFPDTKDMMEQWTQYKQFVTIELILEDYSFDALGKIQLEAKKNYLKRLLKN